MNGTWWCIVLTSLFSCLATWATANPAIVGSATAGILQQAARRTTLLDLSYQFNLRPAIAIDIIQNYTDRQSLEVDVSGSCLGDQGINQIAKALLTWTLATSADGVLQYATTTSSSLFFDARANGLTPQGVAEFLRALMNPTTSNSTKSHPGGQLMTHRKVQRLDFGWNHLHSEASGIKTLCKVLQDLISHPQYCPMELRFDNCGLGPAVCRSIAMGLMQRYIPLEQTTRLVASSSAAAAAQTTRVAPLSLYACGNPAIGDAGIATLAAAIRVIVTSRLSSASSRGDGNDSFSSSVSLDRNELVIFDRLDLSACDIGDAGVEALAVALESLPSSYCCIRHLDLSNNPRITEKGAEILARAIQGIPSSMKETSQGPKLYSLDLSHNKIGDRGGKALAKCLECIPEMVLRSCHIHADGAKAFGERFRSFAEQKHLLLPSRLSVDLSGNPLGTLRGKSKPEGGKYSASHLKSKASATAASYMSHGFNFLKKGLKEVGVDVALGLSSVESDDEEEKRASSGTDMLLNEEIDASQARCGLKAMSNAFVEKEAIKQHQASDHAIRLDLPRKIHIGLRHCFIDHAGASALAQMKTVGNEEFNLSFDFDVSLNPVLEEEMVQALHGENDERLMQMAEEHEEKMRILRESQQKAARARQAAIALSEPSDNDDNAWNTPNTDEWDSDVDYDEEGEYAN